MFGLDAQQLIFLLLVAMATGGAVLALALPFMGSSGVEARVRTIAGARKSTVSWASRSVLTTTW